MTKWIIVGLAVGVVVLGIVAINQHQNLSALAATNAQLSAQVKQLQIVNQVQLAKLQAELAATQLAMAKPAPAAPDQPAENQLQAASQPAGPPPEERKSLLAQFGKMLGFSMGKPDPAN